MRTLIRFLSYSANSPPFLRALGFPPAGSLPIRPLPHGVSNKFYSSISSSSRAETLYDFERDHHSFDDNHMGKDVALRSALNSVAGEFGKECMLTLQHFYRSRRAPVISTGSLNLDLALGIGGLPKGRIVEIYGKEASGKSTLALHIVKEAQRLGGYCAYLDLENAMDPALAESIGVDTDKLLYSRSLCAEDALSMVDKLVQSGSVNVIVVDSVAALVPQCEVESSFDCQIDAYRRLVSQGLRKLLSSLTRSGTLLVLVNQTRSNTKGSEEVTCGGNALKFYAAIRMKIMKRGLIETGQKINGIKVCVQVIKNKLGPAMNSADLDIEFGKGIRQKAEVVDLACKHGLIGRADNLFYLGDKVFEDITDVEEYLSENDEILEELVTNLREQLFI